MDLDDHDVHYALLYYPTNAFGLGTTEELSFFKRKWSGKSDRERVRRIYEDFRRRCDACPCRALLAFNVLRAVAYNDETLMNLPITDVRSSSIIRFAFTNEYQLKTTFFPKRFDAEVMKFNRKRIQVLLPDLLQKCEFDNDESTIDVDREKNEENGEKSEQRRRYANVPNKRKLEKIKPILENALKVADSLSDDVDRLKRLVKKKNVSTLETYYVYNVLRERALKKYLRLDYFCRFRIILTDLDMYLPKMPKNKRFKIRRLAVRQRIRRDCLQFWGISQQRQSLSRNRPDDDDNDLREDATNNLLLGQLLPVNDNPSHPWYYKYVNGCKHDGGKKTIHVQTRSNDEMITTVTFCNICERRIYDDIP